jgi:hypothetical protein
MKFTDDNGVTHHIYPTKAFVADLRKHHDHFDCRHDSAEPALRRRTVAGGGVRIVRQCLRCGASVGSPVKKTPEHASLPPFDEATEEHFDAQQRSAYRDLMTRHLDLQLAGTAEHQKEYATYLDSPEWSAKRAKVLKRAQGLCEGCAENPAVEIHHLTYRHIYEEFLFELVAVCRPCHERLHGKDGEELPEFFCEEME